MTKQLTAWTGYEVRLFPSVHITSEREAELRATASLLAMIRAVSEFGRTISAIIAREEGESVDSTDSVGGPASD